MAKYITEQELEDFSLNLLEKLGYRYVYGPDISIDGKSPERASYKDILLKDRLKASLKRINPKATNEMIDEAVRKLERTDSPNLIPNNQAFHQMLIEGVDVQVSEKGRTITKKLHLIDFENPKNNEFLAVNQYTVIEGPYNRRPDILIFINGIPIVIIELKNPVDPKATIETAFGQIRTYKEQIQSLFRFNELIILSDGVQTKVGTITSEKEWFVNWKLVKGEVVESSSKMTVEVTLEGLLDHKVLLDIIQHYVLFRHEQTTTKLLAQYHQYRAVNNALKATVKAIKADHRAGVIWHTQGSGKSLSMVFYAGQLALSTELENPTIVVLTDRNDLDGQLYDTFSACQSILRQSPTQAESRDQLKELLKRPSGGIIFTTIQKFFPDGEQGLDENEKKVAKLMRKSHPKLSDRKNIIVIADEAHRSQYGVIAGFARHVRDALPQATFIGFTGTPIELGDRDTRAIFGEYIDKYTIKQAVQDKATVPIYYESRLARIELPDPEKPKVDEQFEEVTEKEEDKQREQLKSRWSRLEALVGSQKRLKQVARDIVSHFEARQETMVGKALIVCMSRRICVEMYNEIIKLKPEWHSPDDKKGAVKVIMTGNVSETEWQPHIRNKPRRKEIETEFKKPASSIKIVIVRDMWLTGTDIPCLNTIYIDKPMRGHGLMQAIARVNRVFRDKQGGLVADYIGLAEALKHALANYTDEKDRSEIAIDKEKAVAEMLKNYEIVKDILHGVSYRPFLIAPLNEKLIIIQTVQRILEKKGGKEKFIQYVDKLSKSFSLAYPHEKAIKIRNEVAFFQAIKSQFIKYTLSSSEANPYLDTAIRQIVAGAIVTEDVVDIFDAAGIKKPDISVLSEEFMEEVRNMPQKNLALELLRKLINDEIKNHAKKNVVKSKQFSDMLEESIHRYQNRTIDSAQVIEELIELAKKIKHDSERGVETGLSEDELAFYDALAQNDSAVRVLGDDKLKDLAKELVKTMKKNRAIDWTLRANVQADMRAQVKRMLNRYGYPPDKQQKATETVMEQTKRLYENWIGEDEVWGE